MAKNILASKKKVKYASSIVLGLNDAIVEMTGALTGLTLALQNSMIIAITGLIMGIAASLSMAASEYLSSKEEKCNKLPKKSAAYTGVSYFLTVILLIFPYFIFKNVFYAMELMLVMALFSIAFYAFYISKKRGQKFFSKFSEMAIIAISVAIISFGVGMVLRVIFGIEL